ncbi:MAG: type II toxin-antitoxin system prevent-host-death family antitoxin [Verrucomicrobiales bacterium]|nr:type II toxin-antitoxin system prevent-host-death family antitoxin [Verrucomicrobiales bacterium]
MNYTEARNGLAEAMRRTVEDRDPITITRNGLGAVVMLAEEEYRAMTETLHLLSTPANAECIRRGLAEYEAGKFIEKDLCD